MNGFSAYDSALTFSYAFEILNNQFQNATCNIFTNENNHVEMSYNQYEKVSENSIYKDLYLASTVAVNGCLACELFIKSMLPRNTRGHKLYSELFVKLKEEDKETIEYMVIEILKNLKYPNYNKDNFIADFKKYEYGFEEFRYWYEAIKGKDKEFNLYFIMALHYSLKYITKEKFGFRPIE